MKQQFTPASIFASLVLTIAPSVAIAQEPADPRFLAIAKDKFYETERILGSSSAEKGFMACVIRARQGIAYTQAQRTGNTLRISFLAANDPIRQTLDGHGGGIYCVYSNAPITNAQKQGGLNL